MRQFQTVFDGQSLITPKAMADEFVSPRGERHDEQLSLGRAELAVILRIAQEQFLQGTDPARIIDRLAAALHETRAKFHPNVWQELIPIAQAHPVAEYFLQDPFTRWSSEKPRGYSGDAQLLDFIYGHASVAKEIERASPVGRALYDYTKDASSSVAVRERRDLLTRHVDEIAASRGSQAEILTIAAGHLREANRSVALQERRIKRWVALDQDPLSVGSISRDFSGTCIEAVDGSVRSLLGRDQKLGKFDFIYAAGLYDYLADKVAIKLTHRCLQMLKPNGVFLFANFAQDIGVDGYMETFMNWALLLRSEADMWNIIHKSAGKAAIDARVQFGANRNIVYGIIQKRA
ncbi:class I SAM-dependent methyltransferase [Ensifer sp. SSB1]|uniref:class I SAM-dependent methyltransferase n=1 Tax=Ensifer sp. SSB1 TaxID=2795385 RepID=UPI000DE22051|nr:class I SAM-dependent methyltransferase [Ensifer sp. SSB1]MBK5571052.1 class I SAM-dependent methyltransferase [Ensifer sp. SSB1]